MPLLRNAEVRRFDRVDTGEVLRVLPRWITDGKRQLLSVCQRGGEALTDREGRSDLHYAAVAGDIAEASRLQEAGADPNLADRMGWTPLHFAAQEQQPNVVSRLVEAGAEIDAKDAQGKTPLAVAVFNSRGGRETVAALLAGGADPDVENHSGISPRKLAETISNYDLSGLFKT